MDRTGTTGARSLALRVVRKYPLTTAVIAATTAMGVAAARRPLIMDVLHRDKTALRGRQQWRLANAMRAQRRGAGQAVVGGKLQVRTEYQGSYFLTTMTGTAVTGFEASLAMGAAAVVAAMGAGWMGNTDQLRAALAAMNAAAGPVIATLYDPHWVGMLVGMGVAALLAGRELSELSEVSEALLRYPGRVAQKILETRRYPTLTV